MSYDQNVHIIYKEFMIDILYFSYQILLKVLNIYELIMLESFFMY